MTGRIAWSGMLLLALGVAGYALANLLAPAFRPDFVQNIFAIAPAAIALHLGAGGVAMVVGALQVNSRLRARSIAAHRWLGRIYVLAVLIGGVAGFILALNAFGGLAAQLGFGMLAVLWLVTTLNAYRHIRDGNVAHHREWMLRSYALTLAGVTLRLYLGLSAAIGVNFADFYPAVSWLCWVPNLLLVEWWVLRRSYTQAAA